MDTFAADDTVVVRLDPGDLFLESITAACAEHEIATGVVCSGIGTLRNLNIHYVPTTAIDDPDERNVDLEFDGAWEVTTVDGMIADGEPHLHVTAYDGERTVGGHLEPGCETNVLGEVVLRRLHGLDLVRRPNDLDISTLERR